MAQCEVCGNDYDKSFEVILGGKSHTFDSFECAIHALVPNCPCCGCRVIGPGATESDGGETAHDCVSHPTNTSPDHLTTLSIDANTNTSRRIRHI